MIYWIQLAAHLGAPVGFRLPPTLLRPTANIHGLVVYLVSAPRQPVGHALEVNSIKTHSDILHRSLHGIWEWVLGTSKSVKFSVGETEV